MKCCSTKSERLTEIMQKILSVILFLLVVSCCFFGCDQSPVKTSDAQPVYNKEYLSVSLTGGTQLFVPKYGVTAVYESSGKLALDRTGYNAGKEELVLQAKENSEKYYMFEEAVVALVNEWREEKGLELLVIDNDLTLMANIRAEEIAWSGNHTHYRPDETYFSSWYKEFGFTKGQIGENIAWNDFDNAQAVCNAWKNSPLHYNNIMNPEFTRIGIGIAPDADPECNFVWVQHFCNDNLG